MGVSLGAASPSRGSDPVFQVEGASPGEYARFANAFADTSGPALTRAAADWLVARLDLEWPIRRSLGGGTEARGYPSSDLAFCVLVSARYGEWGQHGAASYCLVDSSGTVRWMVEGEIAAPPRVSDVGITATLLPAPPGSAGSHPGAHVRFLDLQGQVMYDHSWARRAPYPAERGYRERYLFLPGESLFVTTMNVRERSEVDTDDGSHGGGKSCSLFVMDPVLATERVYALGPFWPKSIELEGNARLRLLGEWRTAVVIRGPPTDAGYYELHLREWTLRKVVTRSITWD